MITSLAQDQIRVAAVAAGREQAWVARNGVLGVPVRLDGEAGYTRHWDLTAVRDVLDRAVALQWRAEELTAWLRGDVAHHFAIWRPDHAEQDSAQADFVSTLSPAVRVAWEVDDVDGTPLYRAVTTLNWPGSWPTWSPAGTHLLPAQPAVLSGGGY